MRNVTAKGQDDQYRQQGELGHGLVLERVWDSGGSAHTVNVCLRVWATGTGAESLLNLTLKAFSCCKWGTISG